MPKLTLKGMKEKPFHFLFLIVATVLVIFTLKLGLFIIFVFMIVFGILKHIYYIVKTSPDR